MVKNKNVIYLVCFSLILSIVNISGCGIKGPANDYREVKVLDEEINGFINANLFEVALVKCKQGLSQIEVIKNKYPDWKKMNLLLSLEENFNNNLNYCEASLVAKTAYNYFMQGQYEEALTTYQKALDMVKDQKPVFTAAVYRRFGDIYFRQQKYEDALKAYNTVLEKYKNESRYIDALSLASIGRINIMKGKYEEALKIQETVLREYPEVEDACILAQFEIGEIYQRMGQYDQALKAWEEIVAKYPNNYFTPIVKSLMENIPIDDYQSIDKYREILPFVIWFYADGISEEDFLSSCLKAGKNYESAAFFFMGTKHKMKNQMDKAVEYFQKSIDTSRDKDFIYNTALASLQKIEKQNK